MGSHASGGARRVQCLRDMRTSMMVAVGMAVSMAACGAVTEKCSEKKVGAPFCVPDAGVVPAGQAFKLDLLNQCLGSCGGATLACEVSRDAGTVTLTLAGTVCEPPAGYACAAACAITHHECSVPALPEGDYTVVSADQPSRALQVRGDAGTAANCTVPF